MTREPLDEGTREADRTEQHPDRKRPEITDEVERHLKVVYGRTGGRELQLDFFTPKHKPAAPRPAIVWLHGGSWWMGNPSQFHFHCGYLASKYGFFAASVDYRLSGEAPFPAALQDAKAAVRWVRARAEEERIDPERIAIGGGSAGAHLSSMILTTAGAAEYEGDAGCPGVSSHVNLGILFNGEFDMQDLLAKGSLIEPMKQFMGGTPEEVPARYEELSSVNRVHAGVPPVLLLHGTIDKCVSHEQSIAFAERINAVGGHAEVELYHGKPHAWFNKEPDRTETMRRVEKFVMAQFGL